MNNNLQKGKLKRWNDGKGFGFIASEGGRRDIFIHISSLKQMSRRPVVGDIITYKIHTDNDGKERAVNASIEGVAEVNLSPGRKYVKRKKEYSWIYKALSIVLLAGIGFIVYVQYLKNIDLYGKETSSVSSYAIESFSCSGKVYCSEMASCDEAKFYQRNCPGTKMDGDRDGIPCEGQWCGR